VDYHIERCKGCELDNLLDLHPFAHIVYWIRNLGEDGGGRAVEYDSRLAPGQPCSFWHASVGSENHDARKCDREITMLSYPSIQLIFGSAAR